MSSRFLVTKGGVEKPRCKQRCPAGIDAPRYIRLIREGKIAAAARVVRERAPLAGVLAYVCPGFCELGCRRSEVDEPVAINALKRFIIDSEEIIAEQKPVKSTNKRIAVIGSGPAGLTAAYYLAKVCGHMVTVFEELPEAGGLMRVGIPEYRLPKRVLQGEIEIIKRVGIDLKMSTRIDSVDTLFEQGFDAIFASVGAWRKASLMIEGEDLPGVVDGLSFLKGVNLGRRNEVGKCVAVIGGGNVAIDAARVARRLGAEDVHVIYRRSREEMPVRPGEVEQAIEERIHITFLAAPIKITRNNGLLSVEFDRLRLGGVDDSGRRQSGRIPGSEFMMEFNTVIVAVGESPKIPLGFGVTVGDDGNILVDPVTLSTSRQGVFAGGDCVTGPATVVEAIAAGKKAVINIDKYLGGAGNIDEILLPEKGAAVQPWEESILEIPRQRMPLMDSLKRIKSFSTVDLGFTKEMAGREADRCLRCEMMLPITVDLAKCVECYSCQTACSLIYHHACNPEKARIIFDPREGIHYGTECVGGCVLCIKSCFAEAISFRYGQEEIPAP